MSKYVKILNFMIFLLMVSCGGADKGFEAENGYSGAARLMAASAGDGFITTIETLSSANEVSAQFDTSDKIALRMRVSNITEMSRTIEFGGLNVHIFRVEKAGIGAMVWSTNEIMRTAELYSKEVDGKSEVEVGTLVFHPRFKRLSPGVYRLEASLIAGSKLGPVPPVPPALEFEVH